MQAEIGIGFARFGCRLDVFGLLLGDDVVEKLEYLVKDVISKRVTVAAG